MDYLDPLFRWTHVVAGILWIGLLYFFNFVNGPFAATMDGDTKKKVVPELLPRALFWFRWGAAWTWFTGVLLVALSFYHSPKGTDFNANMLDLGSSGWGIVPIVLVLFTFLSVHLYDMLVKQVFKTTNVQFLAGVVWATVWVYLCSTLGHFAFRGNAIHLGAMFGTWMAFNVWFRIWPAQKRIITAIKNGEKPDPADPALAGLRSKHNTYMSVPLVFLMLNQHMTFAADKLWMLGVVVLVGWLVTYGLYKKAATIKGF